jgi:cytochrome c-type biogenesis protein
MTELSSGVGLAAAFGAGLASFLSPCVLPLIPSYLTYITGLSLEDVSKSRRASLVHALLFVLGFTMIFVAFGAIATGFGRLLLSYRYAISRIGGILVIIFGLYLIGALNITAFMRDRRIHLADKPVGYLGTVIVGIAFGAGWSPCLGPILGAILTVAASSADSMGLAVPFILAALMVERFLEIFARIKTQMVWVQRIAGVLLLCVGVLMVTGYMAVLSSMMQALTPEFIRRLL